MPQAIDPATKIPPLAMVADGYRPHRRTLLEIGPSALRGRPCGGLVFSALTNTCGRAKCLNKLPHDQPKATDLADTLASLTG